MHVLDCETRESALNSVAALCGIQRSGILRFLKALDLEGYCNNHDCSSGEDALYGEFEMTYGCTITPPARVYWFHMSRCLRGCLFSEGLLPLGEARNCIWHTIHQVFDGTEHMPNLLELENVDYFGERYEARRRSPELQGPYAFLVREVADAPSINGIHDYLRMPETLEDICCTYEARYGTDIRRRLSEALAPVIVKFWTPVFKPYYVKIALFFAYNSLHNIHLRTANTCYDDKNTAIPAEQIVKVEWI